jgi:hypothetical protein
MKNVRHFILIFFAMVLCFVNSVSAQDDKVDVIYLKTGDTLKGRIKLIYPGEGFLIKTGDHRSVKVYAGDTISITRELMPYYYKEKGYYFHGEGNIGMQIGTMIINGYKFSRLLSLGLGLGILYDPKASNNGFNGAYIPVFAEYSGDILKKKVTPYYLVDIGYNIPLHQSVYATQYGFSPVPGSEVDHGGMTGGVGIGGRFNTSYRTNITLCIIANVEYMTYHYTGYDPATFYYSSTAPYGGTYSGPIISRTISKFYPVPAFRFGVGF